MFAELKELEKEVANLRAMQPAPLRLLRGWREIRDACGLTCSIQTMRRLARQHHLPEFYVRNRPSAVDVMIKMWLTAIQKTGLGVGQEKRADTT